MEYIYIKMASAILDLSSSPTPFLFHLPRPRPRTYLNKYTVWSTYTPPHLYDTCLADVDSPWRSLFLLHSSTPFLSFSVERNSQTPFLFFPFLSERKCRECERETNSILYTIPFLIFTSLPFRITWFSEGG